jgi:hypothetical protein
MRKKLPMKTVVYLFFTVWSLALSSSTVQQDETIEFICMRTQKAANACHYNFTVEGAKYRYVDVGCKFSKKQKEVIDKVKAGSLGLSKDWKIECPTVKSNTQAESPEDF